MPSAQDHKTEYHHYIPQFILRNFSHKYRRPKSRKKPTPGREGANKKVKLFPGDPVLNIVDLEHEVPELSEFPVKRSFGMMDMYRDVLNESDHNFLEKEIGKLESRVSAIIADIKKATEAGNPDFSMSRGQRDMLRKFLFIMKYRGPTYHRRFHGKDANSYSEDDAHLLRDYMQKRGFHNAVDVWFECIKAILALDMDVERKWYQELLSKVYPEDGKGFILEVEGYYLAFCVPSDPSDEFVLTENCYNVHEGPNSIKIDPKTGEEQPTAYTPYHEFRPLTPKLMLITRSALLPNAEEDANESIRKERQNMYDQSRRFHSDPESAISTLLDLPLKKPRNSYIRYLPDGLEYLPGEDGSRRSSHRFTFPFFKLSKDHVQKINCALLENAHLTSRIGYESETNLKRSLEFCLLNSKTLRGPLNDARAAYKEKIQALVTSLGSDVIEPCFRFPVPTGVGEVADDMKDWLRKVMKANCLEQPTEFMQLYSILGGSYDTLPTDMEQVHKMRFLRIKVDVTTHKLKGAERQNIRDNLRDLFCQQVPARRIWMYAKTLRAMSLSSPANLKRDLDSGCLFDGPEDIIVKFSHVVRLECLNRLLYFTVQQDITYRRTMTSRGRPIPAADMHGLERLLLNPDLTFGPIGSICNCGIKYLSNYAVSMSNIVRMTKAYENSWIPVWSRDENIEIMTRVLVKDQMTSILGEHLGSNDGVEELSNVLFNIVYPTY